MTISRFNFCTPTFIFGSGAAMTTGEVLTENGLKKVLVVYDEGVKAAGIVDPIIASIEEAGIDYVCFDRVVVDPPSIVVNEGGEVARNEGIDSIVAIGGGSSMDTAKGINLLINNEPPIDKYFYDVFDPQSDVKNGVPLIAIPTTAGTGSEATDCGIITKAANGLKVDIWIPGVTNNTIAIVDPSLTLGIPAKITASTGCDAFAHAAEALTANVLYESPMADVLSVDAIKKIAKWLPAAYADGRNLEARENMMYAASFAGLAFINAQVHAGHALGHTLGALYHIPHGIACAAIIPEVIRYTAASRKEKVKMILEAMGMEVPENISAEQLGELASKTVHSFQRNLGIPTIKELGIPEQDLLKIAEVAMTDVCLESTPTEMSVEMVLDVLKKAYALE